MSIESTVFERTRPDRTLLTEYGFSVCEEGLKYTEEFMNGAFLAEIIVTEEGEVRGKVIETELQEEYLPLRVAMQTSRFVSEVREGYMEILDRIKEACFRPVPFVGDQANRIAARILQEYGEKEDFPWEDRFKGAVFRCAGNDKWYALIMNIPRDRLQKNKEGMVEVINLKQETEVIRELITQPGIYPAWHMQKKHWISVLLDDTVSDDRIMQLIGISRSMIVKKSTPAGVSGGDWIIPSNPKLYSVEKAFRRTDTIMWHQDAHIQKGDTVYLYITAPVSAILYRCRAIETDIPHPWGEKYYKTGIRLKLEKKYPPELLRMNVLKEFGLRSVRGTRRIPQELKKVIDGLETVD